MKKFTAQAKNRFLLFLHLAFLCITLTGISFIYLNPNFGRGLSWLREESFADTLSLKELLEDDIENIFQYVHYKDIFETDGELDMDKDMVSVSFRIGEEHVYTLNDMLRISRSLGYYLDESFTIQGNSSQLSSSSESETAEVLVNWKAYNPNERYREPGDAYVSLEQLSIEVLELLGKYYQVESSYVDTPSNLYFNVSYLDDEGTEYVYTNSPDKSLEEIRAMGCYLYVSGDSILMDTNMKYIPSNITSITALLENYRIYDNSDYFVTLGLDTSYPYDDIYSEANYQYQRLRINYILGLSFLFLGLLGCLITLYTRVSLIGHDSKANSQIELHDFDHLPLECFLALFGFLLVMVIPLVDYIGVKLLHLIISSDYWDYTKKLITYTLVYLILLTAGFGLLRRYKAHTLWTDSLMYRVSLWINRFLSGHGFPFQLAFSFIGFWLVNIILLSTICYLYLYQELIAIPFAYLIIGAVAICFNLWVFFLMWKHATERQIISDAVSHMSNGNTGYKIDLDEFSGKELEFATNINNLGDGLETALNEQVKSERLKADLITNVSHDIKTPLTSIISYVDLLKRENIPDEKVQRYLEVLDQKSQRLKTLTEDLVEASKASSGNLKLDFARIDFVELIQQTNGEFEEKFALRHLELVSNLPAEIIFVEADGRRLWRVLENLYNNAFKYAMENSRIYVDISTSNELAYFTIKNISENPLNIHAEELTERFVRGDVARTTEGSGLGLSIAKSLTELQNGTFQIYIDGDLFKVQVGFQMIKE